MAHPLVKDRYHLLHDFGIRKEAIKRHFDENDRGPELDHVRDLLKRKGNFYTLEEMLDLSGFFCSAHHECVADNPEDYSPLEVASANRTLGKALQAQAILDEIKAICDR